MWPGTSFQSAPALGVSVTRVKVLSLWVFCLLFSTSGACNEYLRTVWIEIERETDCRFILEFKDDGEYFVLNECPIGRETGIRETGKYLVDENLLTLESRIVMWEENLFESKETELLVEIEFPDGYLLINENEKQSKFKRAYYSH